MAVIDLSDEPFRQAQLLAQLGAGIGSIREGLESEEEKFVEATRQAFQENPMLLARAVREAAGTEGGLEAISQLMEIEDPGVLRGISELYPETFEETLDAARRRAGLPAEQAGAETLTAGVERRTGAARIQEGVPSATAQAEAAQAEATTEQAGLEAEVARRRREEGIPDLQVLSEVSELQLGRALNDREMEKLEDLRGLYETLPPDERRRLSISEVAPRYLQDIQHREQMSLQEKLAEMRQGIQDGATRMELAADALDLKSKYLEEFRTLEEQIREVEDPEAGEVEAFIRRYNNLSDDWIQLFPDSPVTIIDPAEALFGKSVKGVSRFRTLMPNDLRASIAAARIHGGQATEDQLIEELQESVPDAGQREEILNATMQRLEEMRSRTEVPMEERVFESIIGGTLNAFGEGFEHLRTGESAEALSSGFPSAEAFQLNRNR